MTPDPLAVPPGRASRARLYVPLAVAILLLGGYAALWLYGASVMRREVAAWVAAEEAEGRTAGYDSLRVRGYPGTLRAMIEAPRWAEPDEWSWQAEQLIVVTLPYDPSRLILTPRGEQVVAYGEDRYALRADDLRVALEEESITAQAGGLSAEGPDGTDLVLAGALVNWTDNGDGTEVIGAELTGLTARGAEGALIMPYLRLAASVVEGEATVEAFQAALTSSAAVDPTLIAGEGALGLDADGYPAGRVEVRLSNLDPLVALITEQGALPEDQARGAASIIGSMADEDGEVALPLTLEDGRLRVGFIPVAELPRVGGDAP